MIRELQPLNPALPPVQVGGPLISREHAAASPEYAVDEKDAQSDVAREKLTSRQTEDLVNELNDVMKAVHTQLSFSIDKDTKRIVVKVLDTDTQEVIRQIPPQELLRFSARIQELLGVLFDESA